MNTLNIILIGIFSTVVIDAYAILLKILRLPTPDWRLIGRWFAYLPQRHVMHRSISESTPKQYEHVIGWVAHYSVGIIYVFIYFELSVQFGFPPSLVSATLFGVVTVLFPWLILQPGTGAGMFARKLVNASQVRILNITTHCLFGLAIYFGFQISNEYFIN